MNSKRSNKKQILLSVLALLVILLVGAGVTYSWIEGGTTYSILTENSGDVRTGANPYTGNGNGVFTKLVLNPESGTTSIPLIKYDANSKVVSDNNEDKNEQNLFFSPVLTKDGSNFFFPTSFDSTGKAVTFRKSNTNDIGTKFINFKFDVEATKKCYLALNGRPTFEITKGGSTIADTSAFRIMLKKGNESVILTTAHTVQQTPVVTDVNGTTGTLTAQPFDNYLYNINGTHKLFEFDKNESNDMEVSVWLDGENASSDLIGSEVAVNMDLIVAEDKFPIYFDAVTYKNNGYIAADKFLGGSIDGHTEKFSNYYTADSDVTATAVANTNYKFVGWYSDSACTQEVTTNTMLKTKATGETTYYAKFQEKPKYTISVAQKTTPSGETGGTVTVNSSGTSYTAYEGATTTIYAAPLGGYRFAGWYKNSACTGTAYSTNASETVTISGSQTYYAKFIKQLTVSISVMTDGTVGGSGGQVQIDDGNIVNGTATQIVDYDTPVTLSASAKQGYDYKGIYTSGGSLVTKTNYIQQQITSNVTYYAKFETKPASKTTIYFEQRSGFGTYSAYVYRKVNGVTTHYFKDWPGTNATYDTTTGYYKYEFETSDTGTFNVIISDGGNNQYPGQNIEGLVGTLGKTYLFKSGSPTALEEFDPSNMVSLTVAPGTTGGSVYINQSGVTSVNVPYGTSVTIHAVPSSGYKFAGWYFDSACTNNIGNDYYMNAQQTFALTSSGITYYAKFVLSTNYVYFDSSSCSWFGNDNSYLAVSTNNGSTYTAANQITSNGKTYWYYNLPAGSTSFMVGRKVNYGTGATYSTFTITRSGTYNLYKINSNCNGGSWGTYTGATP